MFTEELRILEMFQGELMVYNEHTRAVDYYLEKERRWNFGEMFQWVKRESLILQGAVSIAQYQSDKKALHC